MPKNRSHDHHHALARPLPEVFQIINAQTRQPVANPVAKVP